MTTKEKIKEAVSSSNTSLILCNKLSEISDVNDDKCPAKNLLLNIRHYQLVSKESVDTINILYNKSGEAKVINPDLKESLINEGLAREIVNRIQKTRKEMGLEVSDRIRVYYNCETQLQSVIESPESVSLVKPPIIIIKNTIVVSNNNHIITGL